MAGFIAGLISLTTKIRFSAFFAMRVDDARKLGHFDVRELGHWFVLFSLPDLVS
ncbi:hypothetical protein [Galbitalea soli]|uniref:Uncharacterized protein n=1 Tax=Galbitalea soli TaxID=1268042 RepID=A0A7C9TQS3_9MICO|nr:hypothetical protein [Galbitalea soli]NEM90882.1 hypothetical protein [Galbitalea soli]NYJ31603.1 hypothetical protein [Galbitalea soli]